MNTFAKIFGDILLLCGVAAGYFVFRIIFVGGLDELISGIKASPTSANDIVWGIVKMTVLTGLGSAGTCGLIVLGHRQYAATLPHD